MNFFQHQDNARRSTRRLVFLFVIAVILLLIITNVALLGSLWFFDVTLLQSPSARVQDFNNFQSNSEIIYYIFEYFNWPLVLKVSGSVVAVISLVIFLKRNELSGGGKIIAERLGGKRIDLNTDDAHERIILNVVEEMAIASGMPVPPVYLLPENGINAFAAGFNTSDAIIGISKGAIESLNRDQLQGVVAHEFSHIFNGDMRLNINLIAVLAGILFIGHTGWFVVRNFGGRRRRRRSSKDSSSAFFIVGILLIIIGFIGTFFGKLIKAAVSRQREFLADASAVQFTRNPEGISGALKLIGGSRFGSRLNAVHAEEMSHLFFSNALANRFSQGLASYLATHPPLEERIKRIEPRWNGRYLRMADEENVSPRSELKSEQSQKEKAEKFVKVLASGAVLGGLTGNASNLAAGINNLSHTIDTVGEPSEKSYASAQLSLQAMSENIKKALRDTDSAKALMYLMLFNEDSAVRSRQTNYLRENENQVVIDATAALLDSYESYPKAERLSLVDLAIPALKQMSGVGYQDFLKHIIFLVKADETIDLFEWLLHSLLVHYLKPNYEKAKPISAKYRDLSKLRIECRFLLSHLSYFGAKGGDYQSNFSAGFSLLDLGSTQIISYEQLKLEDLNNAIQHFMYLYPLVKPKLLKACAACIQADGIVTIEQFELLRAISALLDCPMPIMSADFELKEKS